MSIHRKCSSHIYRFLCEIKDNRTPFENPCLEYAQWNIRECAGFIIAPISSAIKKIMNIIITALWFQIEWEYNLVTHIITNDSTSCKHLVESVRVLRSKIFGTTWTLSERLLRFERLSVNKSVIYFINSFSRLWPRVFWFVIYELLAQS